MNPRDIINEKTSLPKPENTNSRPPMPAASMDTDAIALRDESL